MNKEVDNKKSITKCLCKEREDYRVKVLGMHCTKRSKIGNFPMCVRHHTKSFCFADCIDKSSHMPSQYLPNDIKKDYLEFVKICREHLFWYTPLYEVPLHKIHVPSDSIITSYSPKKAILYTLILQGCNLLSIVSLKKQCLTSVQPKVPPSLQTSEDVVVLPSSSSLASALLGKFGFENPFAKHPPLPETE